MILEEATKEAFGYYASDIPPEKGKPIIASCEFCGKSFAEFVSRNWLIAANDPKVTDKTGGAK